MYIIIYNTFFLLKIIFHVSFFFFFLNLNVNVNVNFIYIIYIYIYIYIYFKIPRFSQSIILL